MKWRKVSNDPNISTQQLRKVYEGVSVHLKAGGRVPKGILSNAAWNRATRPAVVLAGNALTCSFRCRHATSIRFDAVTEEASRRGHDVCLFWVLCCQVKSLRRADH